MKRHGLTKEEVVRRGREIYEREIRTKVEPEHDDAFLVVDVTTGSYEVDESDVEASDRALRKNPDAVLYLMRINRPAAYRRSAEEAARTERHPGIAFRGPEGRRRAWVVGTGFDVWEIISGYERMGRESP